MHHASDGNYLSLHRKMEAAGYSRYIRIRPVNCSNFRPLRTRKFNGYVSANDVRVEVQAIAHSIDRDAWVLATRYDDISWYLAKVSKSVGGLVRHPPQLNWGGYFLKVGL